MAKNTIDTGDIGESIASDFLVSNGFTIIERNYWRKWGELDIVAREGNMIHFIEVKTVSYETKLDLELAVLRGTWRPEEQVHAFKIKQMHKALQTWISDNKYKGEWVLDVLAVRIVPRETFATINLIKSVGM